MPKQAAGPDCFLLFWNWRARFVHTLWSWASCPCAQERHAQGLRACYLQLSKMGQQRVMVQMDRQWTDLKSFRFTWPALLRSQPSVAPFCFLLGSFPCPFQYPTFPAKACYPLRLAPAPASHALSRGSRGSHRALNTILSLTTLSALPVHASGLHSGWTLLLLDYRWGNWGTMAPKVPCEHPHFGDQNGWDGFCHVPC